MGAELNPICWNTCGKDECNSLNIGWNIIINEISVIPFHISIAINRRQLSIFYKGHKGIPFRVYARQLIDLVATIDGSIWMPLLVVAYLLSFIEVDHSEEEFIGERTRISP